jgi:hypothetical protein
MAARDSWGLEVFEGVALVFVDGEWACRDPGLKSFVSPAYQMNLSLAPRQTSSTTPAIRINCYPT